MIARRLIGGTCLCLAATFVAYALASWSFDPLADLETRQPRPPQAVIDAQAHRLGLHLPIHERFLHWLSGLPTGDLGVTVANQPVSEELWRRAGTSMRLYLFGAAVAVVAGVVLGVRGAMSRRRGADQFSLLWTLVLIAIPTFVLGTLLKILWLPVNTMTGQQILYFSGEQTVGAGLSGGAALLDRLQHLVLPTICIALPQLAFFARYQRAAALDVLGSEFIRTARAKGLSDRRAFWRHGLRSALVPVISLFAFSFGIHLAGGVFTERVFGWHGLGDWVLTAIHDHDATVVATVTLFFAVLVVLAGLTSDVVVSRLDPRVRFRGVR